MTNDDEELSYEDLAIEIEHKTAETLELRAIIRRLTTSGTDPMDPDEPCPHMLRYADLDMGGLPRCVLCGEQLP